MIMALYHRVEQILEALRPVFRRQATFEWFILLLWGVLLTSQPPAITSYLNALGLSEGWAMRHACPLPGKRGRGRPRQWGSAVKLQDLLIKI